MQISPHVVECVDLRQRQVPEQPDPGVAKIWPRMAEMVDAVRDQDRDDVGGHDAPHPVPGIATYRRLRAARRSGLHPGSEQQKTRQHKEDRDAHLHPRTKQAEIALDVFARCIGRVGGHHQKGCDGTDAGQGRDPIRPGYLFKSALGRGVGLGHPLCSRLGAPRPPPRFFSAARSGCRLISTPEMRVFSSAFSVAWGNLAGNSTSEKSGLIVMWPKSLRCKPPSLAMAPTIAPGPILCRLPTAMR